MPGWPIRKNEAGTLPILVFPIYDADGDLVTAAASLDSERSIDQGTFADTSAEATEIATASGIYQLAPTQAELNGDEIAFITKTGTAGAKTAVNVLYTSARNIDDLAFPTTTGRSIDVEATGEVGLNYDNVVGTIDAADIGADAITEAKIADNSIAAEHIAANAIGASELAADAIGASQLATDAVDEIADGVWDELLSGHVTLGSFGQVLNALGARTGEVNDAGPLVGDFDVDGFTEATNDHFNSMVMIFTSGVLLGQGRIISDYVGAGQNCIFERPWTEAPTDGDDFVIVPMTASLSRAIATESDGMAHVDLKEWLGAAPNALIAGAVDADVSAMQADVITAAAIAANAIGSSELATGAIIGATFAAGAIDSAAIAANAIGDSEMAADAFDGLLIRDIDNVEVAAPVHSLTVAILKAVSRVRDNAGTLEIYRTDAVTIKMSQTVTTDAANDPIDELTAGV